MEKEQNIFIYPNTLSTFHGDRQIALDNGYQEITQEEYQHILDNHLITTFIDGKKITITQYHLNTLNT